jgi:hypothetical protein
MAARTRFMLALSAPSIVALVAGCALSEADVADRDGGDIEWDAARADVRAEMASGQADVRGEIATGQADVNSRDASRDAPPIDTTVPPSDARDALADARRIDASADGPGQCSIATTPCQAAAECCSTLTCAMTSLGRVCCGNEGAACITPNGEDCCGDLLCLSGTCGRRLDPGNCVSPCTFAPALVVERQRLASIGGSFLGICGDANHTYGYHVPAARLPANDYSMEGILNRPVCQWHAAAIDIGMDWPVSRQWLRWLIQKIREGAIKNIGEVIGSYDGQNVRYWSEDDGWTTNGRAYTGEGHDTWTHVAIYRSTALEDHRILYGWSANSGPP